MGELGNCVVCGEDATHLYPLLSGSPAFCSSHHNPKDAGPFGCDFSGPDDFDIPFDAEDIPFRSPDLTSENFLWRDKQGRKWPLHEIDDGYLQNIISFLRKRLALMDVLRASYFGEVMVFLEREQRLRRDERSSRTI